MYIKKKHVTRFLIIKVHTTLSWRFLIWNILDYNTMGQYHGLLIQYAKKMTYVHMVFILINKFN